MKAFHLFTRLHVFLFSFLLSQSGRGPSAGTFDPLLTPSLPLSDFLLIYLLFVFIKSSVSALHHLANRYGGMAAALSAPPGPCQQVTTGPPLFSLLLLLLSFTCACSVCPGWIFSVLSQ